MKLNHEALILVSIALANYVFFLYSEYFWKTTGIDVKSLILQSIFYVSGPHLLVIGLILVKYWKIFVKYNGTDSNSLFERIKNENKWFMLGLACLEEVVFRYILPQHLMLFLSFEHSILISSVCFGVMHYNNSYYEEKEGVRHFSSWIMGFSHIVSAARMGHLTATSCSSSFVVGTFLHYWFNFLIFSVAAIVCLGLNMIQKVVTEDPFKWEDLKKMVEEEHSLDVTKREHAKKMNNVFTEMGLAVRRPIAGEM